MNSASRILVIITGGLIVQEYDAKLGYVPNRNPKEIIDTISAEINMETIELLNQKKPIDSKDLGIIASTITDMDNINIDK